MKLHSHFFLIFFIFFFFQAEDGIRVYDVTGVQTCALPIWVQLVDRLAAPNSDEGYRAFQSEFEALATRLFGDGATAQRADADEPRRALGADLRAEQACDLDSLLARLER